jgi:5-methylcytosine-specific restriction endonuclease McrA
MVFVLGKRKKPLMPCSNKRASKLLAKGRARVHKLMPFTIRLVDRYLEDSDLQDVAVKLDPGSKVTGVALIREKEIEDGTIETAVLNLIELEHRGGQIKKKLEQRRNYRHRRRSDNLRYRKPRFLNRRNKGKGWLAPSIQHRVDSTVNIVKKLFKLTPITAVAMELVRFDLQKMENPEISGVEYQQGELAGYEVREYLLEKWGRKCAYCGAENVPLQVEHIQSKAKGATNRVSNLTLACVKCNSQKDDKNLTVFLANKPELAKNILGIAKAPLKDAAAVNSTRWALRNTLRDIGLPISAGSGGQTKYNRARLGIPKTHALDAVCVGKVGQVVNWKQSTMVIKCRGRGSYQRTRVNVSGFPRGYLMRAKSIFGFQTGDLVKADVLKGKFQGIQKGRVAVRKSGSFDIATSNGKATVSHKNCRLVQRGDGYEYSIRPFSVQEKNAIAPQAKALGFPG